MNRYSVLYLSKKQYHYISCETHPEAETILNDLFSRRKKVPVGIYDAKTELFFWEPGRQQQYDRLSLEEQGKLGNEMISIAQNLRCQEDKWPLTEEQLQSDILQRPIFLTT